ncbi:MAG: hypothetical protein A2Z02_04525 [Chloroflexi bacterium RBG_16_48_7]|nr:MAG: hypothetical protein A2Z02_04525 [Chloroflexi bacterium RBG_16_48_7]
MEIPFSRWYPAISVRKSRRQFDSSKSIPADMIAGLKEVCGQFHPFKGARAVFLEGDVDNIFTGFAGSYGKIKGASYAVLFIGDQKEDNFQEFVGYTGEAVILEATSLGLGTCWVGGSFNARVASNRLDLRTGEKVLAVTPVGFVPGEKTTEEKLASGIARSTTRKSLSDLVSGISIDQWQDWVKKALEAARLAPSGINIQPWIFQVEPGGIVVSEKTSVLSRVKSRRLDCGIAMLHLEVAALDSGVKGTWELLESPQVARFKASHPTVK